MTWHLCATCCIAVNHARIRGFFTAHGHVQAAVPPEHHGRGGARTFSVVFHQDMDSENGTHILALKEIRLEIQIIFGGYLNKSRGHSYLDII